MFCWEKRFGWPLGLHANLYKMLMCLFVLIGGVLESNICQSSMIHCLGLRSEIEKTISTGVAIHNMINENGLLSHRERGREMSQASSSP